MEAVPGKGVIAAPEPWRVTRLRGSAAVFHARPVPHPTEREVWLLDVDRLALVLGSAQRDDVVDVAACERAGVEVVRRRSGGGAVLLVPDDVLWVDAIVPAGDPLWDDDVGRASHWLGDAWAAALASAGVADVEVHRGPLVRTRWSELVCFTGVGPGEVSVAGRKVVGISQRRTRSSARFQCAALARWDPSALVELLRPPRPDADELADAATGVGPGVTLGALADAFLAVLMRRPFGPASR